MGRWSAIVGATLLMVGCGAKSDLPEPTLTAIGDAGPTPLPPDACVDLPYMDPAHEVQVSFVARIDTADVLFLVDTTGSMSDEIDRIQSTLRESLVPALAQRIPDVHLSVAELADFPAGIYGERGDVPFELLQASTGDTAAVQRAIDRLPASLGSDEPEAQVEALYQSATGTGRGSYIPPAHCPPGTVGYPCFRPSGARIILLFTDASFHNGPGGTHPYDPELLTAATYPQTIGALRGIGAKVLGLFSGFADTEAAADIRLVVRDTGAVAADGTPIVIDIGAHGELLDTGVVEAVRTLVEEVPIDIDAVTEDWAGDDFDATAFVEGIETLRAEPPGGATDAGNRFIGVHPGTRVSFRLRLRNDLIASRDAPMVFNLWVVLRGDGVTRLSRTLVEIVIPGQRGGSCAELAPGVPAF